MWGIGGEAEAAAQAKQWAWEEREALAKRHGCPAGGDPCWSWGSTQTEGSGEPRARSWRSRRTG